MIRKIGIFFLIILATSRILQNDDLRGTLTIKKNEKYPKSQTAQVAIKAAFNSPQITNVMHLNVRVIVPNPPHGCTPYALAQNFKEDSLPIYFLVSGVDGDCSYARKTELAKKALGNGILIIDSANGMNNLKYRPQQKDRFIIFLVNQGSILNLSQNFGNFVAQINMGKGKQSQSPINTVQIWVSSLNFQSYSTLEWWGNALSQIGNIQSKITWKPRFAFYSCLSNQNCQGSFVSSCACGGQFCSPQYHGSSSNVLIRQDLRQLLIFKQYPTLFLTYVHDFQKKCFSSYKNNRYAEDCATGILHNLGITDQINTKIDYFLSSCNDQNDPEIFATYRQLSLDRAKYIQIGHYPAIILNHELLQFRNSDELKSLLCRKLSLEQQSGCVSITSVTTVISTIITWFFYLMIFTLLLGAGAFVVVFFRNRLRREMNKQMKMQVSTAVQHYFTLSESH